MKSNGYARVRKSLVIALTCIAALSANAQLTFQLVAGGNSDRHYSRVAIQTQDGGYLIGGLTELLDPGHNDMCLIKLDANGDTMWTKIYGDTLNWEEPNKIIEMANGDFMICGAFSPGPVQAPDIFLLRTDAAGTIIWGKSYDGAEGEFAPDFIHTSDGGFILAGQTTTYESENIDMYIIKTNSTGDTLWTTTLGGNYIESSSAIAEVLGGGYLVAGEIKVGFQNPNDNWLVRLDAQGQLLWSSTFGTGGANSATGIVVLPDGGCVIGGSGTNPANNSSDYFLTRRDSLGQAVWSYYYGGLGIHDCFSMQRCSDGGYVMCGVTDNNTNSNWDGMLLKADSTGQLLWSHKYGSGQYDYFDGLSQTADNGFIISGGKTGSNAMRALYIVKTDAGGNSLCNTYALPLTPYSFFTMSLPVNHIIGHGGLPGTQTFPVRGYMPVTTLCSNVGTSENELPQTTVQLFPNPGSSCEGIVLSGSWTLGKPLHIGIYDVSGRLVLQGTYDRPEKEIPLLPVYAPGVYTIQVNQEGRLPGYVKWVIR